MKKTLALLGVMAMAASISVGANAKSKDKRLPPLMTLCKMQIETGTLALGGELGLGWGKVKCQDGTGHKFKSEFAVLVGGVGWNAGACLTKTHFQAVGVGFTWDQFLAGIVQVEVGSRFLANQTVGAAVKVNPVGSNIDISLTDAEYQQTFTCAGVGGIKGYTAIGFPKLSRY